MTNNQEIIARSTSQVMSSMDPNFGMYDGQQQKQQVEESVLERAQSLYPPLNSMAPIMSSSVYDFRMRASNADPANLTLVESAQVRSMRLDEELKNHFQKLMGDRALMDGSQHNALQQGNPLQQGQHPSTTFQQLQVQLQKQQQQMQRTGTDVSVPGSISGSLPLQLPASVAAARAAGDVLYPALPQQSVMATQEAIAERSRAVVAAAAAAAAAKKGGLTTDIQNMNLGKPPGSPPPADSRTPPPTLASLAALHVEPPPPYVSNPSLAAYRSALVPQPPYSAHLASIMSGLSSTLTNPALTGFTGLSGVPGVPGVPLPGGITGVTPSAAHTIPSLPFPTQLPAGLAHLSQPSTNLQLPPLPQLPSLTSSMPLPGSAPQASGTPVWQNNSERDNRGNCHSGMCHNSQPMTMIPMPVAMPFPMHMHSCCGGSWMPSAPVFWAMGSPACCSNGNACNSGAGCCNMPAGGQVPLPAYPNPRAPFQLPNGPPGGLVQTGPPGYRIPASLNTRNVATSTLNIQQQQQQQQQQLPDKPKVF